MFRSFNLPCKSVPLVPEAFSLLFSEFLPIYQHHFHNEVSVNECTILCSATVISKITNTMNLKNFSLSILRLAPNYSAVNAVPHAFFPYGHVCHGIAKVKGLSKA